MHFVPRHQIPKNDVIKQNDKGKRGKSGELAMGDAKVDAIVASAHHDHSTPCLPPTLGCGCDCHFLGVDSRQCNIGRFLNLRVQTFEKLVGMCINEDAEGDIVVRTRIFFSWLYCSKRTLFCVF